ncbi:hypothetical protein C8J24_1718 [Sphingomonas aerolata]|uniref:Uncharacterized protein n=1 Tax=Sphingomonas aerolata TaxID=185951 RepID=A0A2T4YPQ1_9SPHN|nr:hypothetical protein [Sphingomonas aerolata]PTM45497.1 hypothetical protein C8J24_1718 [Sphingomonas aerolata]
MSSSKARYALLITANLLSIATGTVAHAQTDSIAKLPKFLSKLLSTEKRSLGSAVENLDVAGAKLGMSPEQVRSALKAGGFTPQATDPIQSSWSALVADKIAERGVTKLDNSKVSMFTMASGPQGERIEVWYSATPQGARANSVLYRLPTNRMEKSTFLSGVKAKYGRPTVDNGNSSLYCSPGEQKCVSYDNKQFPYLAIAADYSYYEVSLRNGMRYSDDYRADMAKAIEIAAPKSAKTSF